MPRYAITFDLDRKQMLADGYSEHQINNNVYTGEVKEALAACGFTEHPEGSVYHTKTLQEDDSLTPIVQLQTMLRQHAPTFCKYVRSIHLFKMEGWSNITDLIRTADTPADKLLVPKGIPTAGQTKPTETAAV